MSHFMIVEGDSWTTHLLFSAEMTLSGKIFICSCQPINLAIVLYENTKPVVRVFYV
jgi:hypothetical protein